MESRVEKEIPLNIQKKVDIQGDFFVFLLERVLIYSYRFNRIYFLDRQTLVALS